MKLFLTAAFFVLSTVSFAQTFIPSSGLKITCDDEVAGATYVMQIIDIGDEEGALSVIRYDSTTKYNNVVFNENSYGSSFIVLTRDEEFSVVFPNNDLAEAYMEDRGDSRGLSCTLK